MSGRAERASASRSFVMSGIVARVGTRPRLSTPGRQCSVLVSTASKSEPVERLQRVQLVVVPARVRGAGDVPRRAVVGQEHPVALEGGEDDPRLRPEAR